MWSGNSDHISNALLQTQAALGSGMRKVTVGRWRVSEKGVRREVEGAEREASARMLFPGAHAPLLNAAEAAASVSAQLPARERQKFLPQEEIFEARPKVSAGPPSRSPANARRPVSYNPHFVKTTNS